MAKSHDGSEIEHTIGEWQLERSHGKLWVSHVGFPQYDIEAGRVHREGLEQWCEHLGHKRWVSESSVRDFRAIAALIQP